MDTRRDFIFVDDLVDVVMKAIDGAGQRGYYHISTGKDYSVKELFDATLKALQLSPDTPVEMRARGVDDVFTILIDPSKTNKDFNWTPKTSLQDGIQKAIDWYKKFGISQTFTHLKIDDKKH